MDSTGRSLEEAQAHLAERLGSGGPADMESGTLVVVPSITFPPYELQKITGIQYYEERLLFLLLLLRNPELRIVYATSLRIEEPIVDYYLRFLPRESEPGDRLYLVALWDQEPRALTHKLLEQGWALERLGTLAEGDSCLLTFNVTEAEKELAEKIDVPLYGCRPDLIHWGSKSGSRKVAAEAGVALLPGVVDVHSPTDLEAAIRWLKEDQPDAPACVVKLNNGFSGQGNLIIELDNNEFPLAQSSHTFCAPGEDWDGYLAKLADEGGVVEELTRHPDVVSPSVQMRIAPDGSIELLSTHDQVLGGPDDQVYLGCRFPAADEYRLEIQDVGMRVGKVLASKGVMGSFGIDLLVEPDGDGMRVCLSEINLRLGGTTHPYLMAKYVTGGEFDPTSGHLLVDGSPRYYVSSDNLKDERYEGLLPEQLIRALDDSGLAFDPATNVGVTLHLLGALKRFGKVGAVCIGSSRAQADELFERFTALLDDLAN